MSDPVALVPAEPPPVLQVPANVTVLPGAGAVLSCLVLSAGRYNLTWQRHGRDARLQDPLRLRVLANLSLELRPARLSDAGSYSCTAANEGGSATASVFLTVQGKDGIPRTRLTWQGSCGNRLHTALDTSIPASVPRLDGTQNDLGWWNASQPMAGGGIKEALIALPTQTIM